jgi:Rad3-related DNA helicase
MSITNYHTYLAHRLYKSTLIVDEAHLMVSMLQDLATRRIWRREYNWPTTCRTTGDLVDWLDALKASGRTLDAKLTRLYRELTSIKPSSLVIRTTESWRNSPPQDVLKIIPLDTRAEPPVMWPGHRVRKIVLMSATISPKDIETMGLDNRRVTYLEAKSPIPVSQRPIKFDPVGSMSYRARSATMPALVARIRSMMNSRPTKGLIHATYDVADALREEMATDPRMIFHGRDDKMTVYDKWRRSDPDDGKVLVACGMYEGIDVVGDAGRWQVITKVPFPSLTDPAIRAKLQDDRDWYLWNTLRLVVQAAGRICRTPDDYGETVIVDSDWERLAADADASGLMPTFFKEALTD